MAKKKLDRPEKVRTSLEEVEVLTLLKDSLEWAIFKRVCERYLENLRKTAFSLPSGEANLMVRHAQLKGEALGIKAVVKHIDDLGKRK